jgi:1,2-diacylglycerol 3-beta-galactosyltransferase
MSDTGGGHRSAAEAIAEAITEIRPGEASVRTLDFISRCAPFPINKVRRIYRPMVNLASPLWGWIFRMSDNQKRIEFLFKIFLPTAERRLAKLLLQWKPDVVVSVHPLANHLLIRAERRASLRFPFITVVTDLVNAHVSWFCPDVDLCIIPTERVLSKAISCGIPYDKVKILGLPVGLKFSRGLEGKKGLKEKLGLLPDLQTVLLIGGGEGMGKVFEIAEAISKAKLKVQLIVVAGRNDGLRRRLEGIAWEIPVKIYGFVENMPELMGASDVIVTKAGPLTIGEAIASRLPIILSGAIPGQEEGNVAYVVDNGVGLFADEPDSIVEILSDLLGPHSDAIAEMARKARSISRPEASLEIAAEIFRLIEAKPSNFKG